MGKIKLPFACNITTGKLDANSAENNGVYPFFTCGENPERINSYAFDDDVIILAGNNAQGNFHIQRYTGKFNAYQRTYVITVKEGFDIDYIKYSIELSLSHLKKIAQGSQTKFLTMSILNEFEIEDITLEKQKKLVASIVAIDKKIENNNAINNNLQSILNTFYDYNFIKPTQNEVLSEKYTKILCKDILEIKTGKEDANFGRSNGKYKFFTCSKETLKCDIPAFSGHAILISGNGDFNVKHYCGEFNAYQRTYVLIPKNDTYYGVLYMAALKLVNRFKNSSAGSIVKFISKSDIENIELIIPNNENLLLSLNKYLHIIEKNEEENEKLINIRDFLLPLLMNGQATIEE